MSGDVIIIGSGASAVQAAYPLVEAGVGVTMLDLGNEERVYASLVPDSAFPDIRRTDDRQHRYFLGDRFEGVPLGPVKVGPQLTPPRQYIIRDSNELTPIDSEAFFPFASLAMGGMASGWGAGAMAYSREELKGFPVSYGDLLPHYEAVAERIGVSGEVDDLYPFDGELKAMFPPLHIDRNAQSILNRYEAGRSEFNAAGLFLGKTRLAALSREFRGRGPDRYLDMSFWADTDQSVWRPRYTLEEMKGYSNFEYRPRILVAGFKELENGGVEVTGRNVETGKTESHRAKKVIVAAGVLGTARIVLRSLNRYEVKVPFVCNPYTYYPMINIGMLGSPPSDRAHSLAQLCAVYLPPTPGRAPVHGRVHSFRSLLNFKIIKEMPIPYREAMRVMKTLLTALTIVALDHEDRPGPGKYCRLKPGAEGGPDRLEIVYAIDDAVRREQIALEKNIIRLFRRLGCYALKRVWPGYGASLHYGGTFPMTLENRDLTVTVDGLLRGTRSVYLADASVFPFLPAKGMTFTMMANADRIGRAVRKELT